MRWWRACLGSALCLAGADGHAQELDSRVEHAVENLFNNGPNVELTGSWLCVIPLDDLDTIQNTEACSARHLVTESVLRAVQRRHRTVAPASIVGLLNTRPEIDRDDPRAMQPVLAEIFRCPSQIYVHLEPSPRGSTLSLRAVANGSDIVALSSGIDLPAEVIRAEVDRCSGATPAAPEPPAPEIHLTDRTHVMSLRLGVGYGTAGYLGERETFASSLVGDLGLDLRVFRFGSAGLYVGLAGRLLTEPLPHDGRRAAYTSGGSLPQAFAGLLNLSLLTSDGPDGVGGYAELTAGYQAPMGSADQGSLAAGFNLGLRLNASWLQVGLGVGALLAPFENLLFGHASLEFSLRPWCRGSSCY